MREGKLCARLCVTLLFFLPADLHEEFDDYLLFLFFLREDGERQGTSDMSPTFRLQLSPSGDADHHHHFIFFFPTLLLIIIIYVHIL